MYDALKAEADARDAALWREWWPRLEAMLEESMSMTGHSCHWDRTGQHGIGCKKCIGQRRTCAKIMSTLAAVREAAGKEARNG